MNKDGPSASSPATASKGAGKSANHFADTVDAINDNWWHTFLSKSGDEALNTTLVGFVSAVPLWCPGIQFDVPEWKGGIMPWGNELIDPWRRGIEANGGTGLKTPEKAASSNTKPATTPPGTWQTTQVAPPQNPPDLAKLQAAIAAAAQQQAGPLFTGPLILRLCSFNKHR